MRDLEHQDQKALMRWVAWNLKSYPELALLYAIPNGGQRNRIVAAKLKAEGVKAGVPDLNLAVARGGYHGLYIELKAEKGKPSDNQKVWIAALRTLKYRVEVCHGWDKAKEVILNYLEEV